MAIEYRTCLYCGKAWRTGTMDLNRYCSVGCWTNSNCPDEVDPRIDDDLPSPRQELSYGHDRTPEL